MGTNYYAQTQPTCTCCNRSYPELHIGKSSAGWVFALHVYPEQNINDLADWEKILQTAVIRDEYGESLTADQMLDRITKRWRETPPNFENDPFYQNAQEFYEKNDAELGPKNLLRAKIGKYCIGHGEGTWDLIVGEFS